MLRLFRHTVVLGFSGENGADVGVEGELKIRPRISGFLLISVAHGLLDINEIRLCGIESFMGENTAYYVFPAGECVFGLWIV